MGVFKRLCMFIFGLVGLATLAALVLPWFGPWQYQARQMMYVTWYYQVLQVCVVFLAVVMVIFILRALFAPRNLRSVVITRSGGDRITVTRDAIASQATHLIEQDKDFTALTVRVICRRHAGVQVAARIEPHRPVDVVEEGGALHERLVRGLADVCGDKLKSVDLEFVDARSHERASEEDDLNFDPYAYAQQQKQQAGDQGEAGVPLANQDDITVRMGPHATVMQESPQTPPADQTSPDAGTEA